MKCPIRRTKLLQNIENKLKIKLIEINCCKLLCRIKETALSLSCHSEKILKDGFSINSYRPAGIKNSADQMKNLQGKKILARVHLVRMTFGRLADYLFKTFLLHKLSSL